MRVVPRKGDVDRNAHRSVQGPGTAGSSPARGTWIEMPKSAKRSTPEAVVPRKGDVDRNGLYAKTTLICGVVPRKGDVDRNSFARLAAARSFPSSPARGTWIEMCRPLPTSSKTSRSSPARGTWIESSTRGLMWSGFTSSPARGTWIEISQNRSCRCPAGRRRPPQGGRW